MISRINMPSRRALLTSAGKLAMTAPLLSVCGCGQERGSPASRQSLISGTTMGTIYRIAASPAKDRTHQALRADIEEILSRVNAQLSTYRSDSELSRFNAGDDVSWIGVSSAVASVAEKAIEISRRSGGGFDPTVAGLVNLWGFGPEVQTAAAPGALQIRHALPSVGHDKISVRIKPSAIRKTRPGLQLDFSGIGKGTAVDRIADHLKALGVERFLVDIGGDLRTHRQTPADATWRIGIEHPVVGPRAIRRTLRIGSSAVATSGNYRNFIESQGVRYTHIIDPRTGTPIRHELASVTVIAATAEEADAWSTALMVLGPRAGLDLAEREGLPAYFIVNSDNRLTDVATREFGRFIVA